MSPTLFSGIGFEHALLLAHHRSAKCIHMFIVYPEFHGQNRHARRTALSFALSPPDTVPCHASRRGRCGRKTPGKVPYDVVLWGVFRGDEAALRSMKERSRWWWLAGPPPGPAEGPAEEGPGEGGGMCFGWFGLSRGGSGREKERSDRFDEL